jgi:cytochrome b pre-mRNA-processing protein 3
MLHVIRKLFGNQRDQDALVPLYNAAVAAAREPHWFVQGQVPDTVDGRFDVLISVLSLVLVRMEQLPGQDQNSVWLTELFIEDMDGQLRQIGIGDHGVGKHVGKIMGALGGRLEAFRDALTQGEPLEPLVLRNIYTEQAPDAAIVAHTAGALNARWAALQNVNAQSLLAGELGA